MTNNKEQLITPISLTIRKDIWEEFKSTVNRDRTLNQAIVDLIRISLEEKDGNLL